MKRPTIVQPVTRTGLEELVEEWLTHSEAHDVGLRALGLYRSALDRFVAWGAERGVTEPDQITTKLLNEYKGYLEQSTSAHGKPLSAASVLAYTRPINTFLRWASLDPDASDDRTGGGVGALRGMRVPRKKLPKRTIDVLSRDEIRDMEDAATTERDKLIIRVLGDTGIRLGELLMLTEDRLVSTSGPRGRRFIKVIGKGDKERDVPLSPALYERMRRYITKGRPKDTGSDLVFVGLRRDPRTKLYEPLTESGAEQMVRLTAQAAGIRKRVYPHLFRHSAITHMLRRKVNPVIVAEIAGHADLKMIKDVYSHLSRDDHYDAMMEALREN